MATLPQDANLASGSPTRLLPLGSVPELPLHSQLTDSAPDTVTARAPPWLMQARLCEEAGRALQAADLLDVADNRGGLPGRALLLRHALSAEAAREIAQTKIRGSPEDRAAHAEA